MGRPREHGEGTRSDLLAAAETLLLEEGVQNLAVRTVALRARTTTRAVYSIFGSKEGLVSALYQESLRRLIAAVDAVPDTGDPLRALLAAGIDGFRRYALSAPHLFRIVFGRLGREVIPTRTDDRIGLEALGRLRRRVQRCADAGIFRPADVPRIAIEFHAFCQGLASVESLGWLGHVDDPRRLWEEALAAFADGWVRRSQVAPVRRVRARTRKSRGR